MEIIKPHKQYSREVMSGDLERVYKDSEEISLLLNKPLGRYPAFYAIAHPQCEDQDPLKFFVINPSTPEFKEWKSIVIINPKIIRHTKQVIEKEEGCASFADRPPVKVERFHKCEVEFRSLEFDENKNPVLSERKVENLSGTIAQVFQHEIDHFDAVYIHKVELN